MYILQRLTTVAWFVWVVATINALAWMNVFLYQHSVRVAASEDKLIKHPEIMHWEKIGKKWMIISIWIVIVSLSYLIFVP